MTNLQFGLVSKQSIFLLSINNTINEMYCSYLVVENRRKRLCDILFMFLVQKFRKHSLAEEEHILFPLSL